MTRSRCSGRYRSFPLGVNTINVMPMRQAQPDDWPFIIRMAQAASTLDDRPLPAADSSAVQSLLPTSPEAAIIAFDEHRGPVGAAWWFLHDPALVHDGGRPVPEMAMAVVGAQRRQGIGTALIESLVAEVAETSEHLSLNVHLLNPAVHLYVRTGFEVAGRGRGVYGVAMVRATSQ